MLLGRERARVRCALVQDKSTPYTQATQATQAPISLHTPDERPAKRAKQSLSQSQSQIHIEAFAGTPTSLYTQFNGA